MRNKSIIIVILVAGNILISCGSKSKQSEKSAAIARYYDSIYQSEKLRADSLAIIAWGDAKFGMTKEEVFNTQSFKGAHIGTSDLHSRKQDLISFNQQQRINFISAFELSTSLDPARLLFGGKDNDELYKVEIASDFYRGYNSLDNFERDCKNLIKNLKEKYGEPINEDLDFNLQRGQTKNIEYWVIGRYVGSGGVTQESSNGKKSISFSICESSSGGSYRWFLNIDNNKFPTTKYEPTDVEKAQQAKEDSIKQAKENYKRSGAF